METWTKNRVRVATIASAVLLTAAVGAAQWFAGSEWPFYAAYLAPVALAAWYAGRAGMVMAVASGAAYVGAAFLPHRSTSVATLAHAAALVVVALCVALLITRLQRALQRESDLARIDSLTGIPNRREFYDAVLAETNRARRYERFVTLVYLAVDNVSAVNERLGRDAGDLLLVEVARTISSALRNTDMVARVGGNEFALLLPETTGEGGRLVMERIHGELRDMVDERGWRVWFNSGVAAFAQHGYCVDEMVSMAAALTQKARVLGPDAVVSDFIGADSLQPVPVLDRS